MLWEFQHTFFHVILACEANAQYLLQMKCGVDKIFLTEFNQRRIQTNFHWKVQRIICACVVTFL